MVNIDGQPHMTIAEAVEFLGCSDGWVRSLLRDGKLRGKRVSERLWMVSVASAIQVRDGLSTRSTGKRHLAKRPAAARKRV